MHILRLAVAILAMTAITPPSQAGTLDRFDGKPQTRWSYVADGVMGGASTGQAAFGQEGGTAFVRLTGTVSTDNNGGFIQVRRFLPDGLPAGTSALILTARGNGEAYHVFVRTKGMARPWMNYKAAFTPGADWSDIRLPLADFAPSQPGMPARFDPVEVISIGLAAYGRDFMADLSVAAVFAD